MRRTFTLALVMVLALSFTATGAATADTPQDATERAWVDLDLNLGALVGQGGFEDIVWYGTVTFEDAGTFGVVFYTVTTHQIGATSFWTEAWEVYGYDAGLFEVTDGVLTGFDPGALVMSGTDAGITHWKKFIWMGDGVVDYAGEPFAELRGASIHTSGGFDLGTFTAEGIMRFH